MEVIKLDYPPLPIEAVRFCCEKYFLNYFNCFDKSDEEFLPCGEFSWKTEYSTIGKARSVSKPKALKLQKSTFSLTTYIDLCEMKCK